MKKHLPLILLAVMAFAASCTPDTPSYVDTVVGKYYTIGKNYDSNGTLYYQDTGFKWIRKIGDFNDRVLHDPGGDIYIQDNDSLNVFKFTLRGVIVFKEDSIIQVYYGDFGKIKRRRGIKVE